MVVGCAGANRTLVMKRLAASRTTSVIQNDRMRNGFGRGGGGGLGGIVGVGARVGVGAGPRDTAISGRSPACGARSLSIVLPRPQTLRRLRFERNERSRTGMR